ncbi:MAG TPA: LLM class flavin-dependent oxidoreductase [Actinomycetota bacterium]|nr:LLM class flavin-dependent oxidoreductase [Actinomycetota bacterium]
MRIGYAPWGESLQELTDAARAAEDAGFSDVWVSELHRSAFVPAAAIATRTSKVRVGTAIALGFVRSPMTTALTALDLDELTGGRFVLGLGSGVQRLNVDWHNARFGKAAPHLRETIEVIRLVMAGAHRGEPISFEGKWERIALRGYERPFPPVRESVPIYIAAVGDVMTKLAGEVGDGWIGHELGSPSYLSERLVPNLSAGLERGGRARDALDVVASACCVIDDDSRQAKRWAAGLVAFYASVRTYEDFFDFHGFLTEARRIQERFRNGDEQGMVEACPDEMVDALTLSGTPEEVREKLGRYEGLVDAMKLSPPTHFVPPEVTRSSQKAILEVLAP